MNYCLEDLKFLVLGFFTVISDENLEFVIIVELDYGANGRHRVELELFKAFAVAFAQ